MNLNFSELLNDVSGKIWIAYSGGLDSTVLLHLAAQYTQQNNMLCEAIHVHHGLNKQADDWVLHCKKICSALNIPVTIERVEIENKGKGVEAAARDARYDAFAAHMHDNDVLLTAHHQDDQIETLFLRLFRGTGVRGLGGMQVTRPLQKGMLVRPLMHYSRESLLDYANNKQLQWIEDNSNYEMHFDRNFIRHELMPKIKTRRKGVEKSLLRTMKNCKDADELLIDLAAIDFKSCSLEKNELSVSELKTLSVARQYNVLRYWLKLNSVSVPDRIKLKTIISDAISSKYEARPIVDWPDGEVVRLKNTLFCRKK